MSRSHIESRRFPGQTGLVNKFAVIQYASGKLEIVELSHGFDPVDLARNRNAFLVGITAGRSRAEFILQGERGKLAGAARR